MPIGVNSKKPSVERPRSAKMPMARMLAGVPIRVILPPSSDEKERGMSNLETAILVRREMPTMAGMSIAVAPTLFMNAEITPQVTMIVAISLGSLSPANRRMPRPITSATPVLNSPPDTI